MSFEPSGLKIKVQSGTSLLEAANKAGIYLSSICGGGGYCGKCKVIVDSLDKIQIKKTSLLNQNEFEQKVVLACQSKVLDDVTVTVPEFHALQTTQILIDEDKQKISQLSKEVRNSLFEFAPLASKIYIEMSPPTVHDHTADKERLFLALREKTNIHEIQVDLSILQNLSELLQNSDYKVTVTVGYRGDALEILDIENGNQCKKSFAIAVDIGTTTIVAHLVDLIHGQTIDTEAVYNSQINFGEDYIRRIMYAEENNSFDKMQNLIVDDINKLVLTLATRQKIKTEDILLIVCSGNTAMIHFLLKLDAKRIRKEPYVPSVNFAPPIYARQIGIDIHKRGLLHCVPCVAAYVGGDIVAGILAAGIFYREGISLFVDIGTNGEIVLGNKDWLVCASSSAGPAFEGSGVKHGMRAAPGAIEKFSINNDGSIELKTIAGKPPVGICGSGLLDILAQLFIHEIIDRTGRFHIENSHVSKGDEGLQFQIVPPSDNQKEIVITQADIENLIRSKAGVFAAIKVLIESTQTKQQDIDAIYLAGGFGNYLNLKEAVFIGLLPDIAIEKIHFVGNTSVAGAKTVLLSQNAQKEADTIASNMTYFDLMSHQNYMEEFMRAKFLPHTELELFPSVKEVMRKVNE